MITRREDGAFFVFVTSLIVGVLNGISPSLRQVRDMAPAMAMTSLSGDVAFGAVFRVERPAFGGVSVLGGLGGGVFGVFAGALYE